MDNENYKFVLENTKFKSEKFGMNNTHTPNYELNKNLQNKCLVLRKSI